MTILPKGRVLLVDDEPLVLEMFESILSQEGYDVFVAASSKGALAHLERTFFDVIVCDVKLEDLDGFEVMAVARKKHPQIGVVLITGAPSEPDAQRAAVLDAAYLSKPIGFELLISVVASAFGNKFSAARGSTGHQVVGGKNQAAELDRKRANF